MSSDDDDTNTTNYKPKRKVVSTFLHGGFQVYDINNKELLEPSHTKLNTHKKRKKGRS
jgi:hypothetical protein